MQLALDIGVTAVGKREKPSHRHTTWDAVRAPLCQLEAAFS